MIGRIVLTAAEMRAAEEAAIAAGTPVGTLMERAGVGAADAIWRYAGQAPALVLCGPGNNGGDGYVVARELRAKGVAVRVAATGAPKTPAAAAARAGWDGPVEELAEAKPAPLLIDALFGTGLARPLDPPLVDRLADLAGKARIRAAIDLPSGVATDDGTILSSVPDFDLTVTFQTLKPAHLLQPAARHVGRVAIVDIGIDAASDLHEIARPILAAPGPDDHKYTRGYVLVVGGEMPGAAALAAAAAARSGAGYVVLVGGEGGAIPNGVIRRPISDLEALLADKRVDAVLIGPGLGRDGPAWNKLAPVLSSPKPVVVDGDGLWLLAEMGIVRRPHGAPTIATPHAGEFEHLYGDGGNKIEATRGATRGTGDYVVFKGADTVVAAPDGRAAIAASSTGWLATAGTGDVLAGVVTARLAGGMAPFEAACAGVWLHARAAELAGPFLIADDLVAHLPAACADCL